MEDLFTNGDTNARIRTPSRLPHFQGKWGRGKGPSTNEGTNTRIRAPSSSEITGTSSKDHWTGLLAVKA